MKAWCQELWLDWLQRNGQEHYKALSLNTPDLVNRHWQLLILRFLKKKISQIFLSHCWSTFLLLAAESISNLSINKYIHQYPPLTSLVAQMVKASAYHVGDLGSIPGLEDPLEKERATHSSTPAWTILWMEKSGRLQSMGLQRVGRDWVTSLSLSYPSLFPSILTQEELSYFAAKEASPPWYLSPSLYWPWKREAQSIDEIARRWGRGEWGVAAGDTELLFRVMSCFGIT